MILRLFALVLIVWIAGLVLFVVTLPRGADMRRTDAVVVLTGGPGRIERGLGHLSAGRARRMLISGVDRTVRPGELAARYPDDRRVFACCVDLGHEAVDTRSNALETAAWMKARGYRSVRLVTTDWHLPRARFELGRALDMPGVLILSDGVRSTPPLSALLREYNKYLLRRAAVIGGWG